MKSRRPSSDRPLCLVLDGHSPLAPTVVWLLVQHRLRVALGYSERYKELGGKQVSRILGCLRGTVEPSQPVSKSIGGTDSIRVLVYPSPETDDFEPALIQWVEQNRPVVILPLDLLTLLVIQGLAGVWEQLEVVVPFAPEECLGAALDRAVVFHQAKALGLPLPQAAVPHPTSDLSRLAAKFPGPVAIVPRSPLTTEGATVVEDAEEMVLLHGAMAKRAAGESPLLVETIPPSDGWLAVTLLCDIPGGVMAQFTEHWTGWVSSAEHPRWRQAAEHRRAEFAARRLLEALEWVGPATVQFACDPRDSVPKLLQIWPCLSTAVELAAAAGLDLVWPLIEWALDLAPSFGGGYRTGLYATWRSGGIPWMFAPRLDLSAGMDWMSAEPAGHAAAFE